MFTGIIRGLFPVVHLEKKKRSLSVAIAFSEELLSGLEEGASVAIDGVCLTVVRIQNSFVFFDVIEETLLKTTLSSLFIGRLVNVERSLKMGQEIGGHLLSGHIMGCGEILVKENDKVTVGVDPSWSRYMLHKGFIAVDGISLTLDEVASNHFSFHLIPETKKRTTLGVKQVKDLVNIEVDAEMQRVVSTIERYKK